MSENYTKASEYFDKALNEGLINKSGQWFKLGDKTLGMGRDNAIKTIHSDPALIEEISSRLTVKDGPTVVTEDQRVGVAEATPQEAARIAQTIVGGQAPAQNQPVSHPDDPNLGIREHRLDMVVPHETEMADGRKVQSFKQGQKIEFLQQPIIDATEAKMLGISKDLIGKEPGHWHEYKLDKRYMTVVPQSGTHKGRRFMVLKSEFAKM